jgi:hypothetical protein
MRVVKQGRFVVQAICNEWTKNTFKLEKRLGDKSVRE